MVDGSDAGVRDERQQFALGEAASAADDQRASTGGDAARAPPRSLSFDILTALARSRQALAAALLKEWARGTAFLFLPVCLGAGALVYFVLPAEPAFSAIMLGCIICAVATMLAASRFALRLLFAAALTLMLGMAAGKLETRRADTAMLGSDIPTRITGRVMRVENQASGRVRFTIDVLATARPHLRYAPDRVRLTARANPDSIVPGEGVTGYVRLMSPSGPVRPLGYDFSFESYFDGIGAVGFFMSNPEAVDLGSSAPMRAKAAAWLERTRLALAEHIRRQIGGPEGEIAAALMVGMREGIPEEINEALRRSGLAHILAISGLHMALVAVTVMGTIRFGFAFFPGFSSRHPVKKYAAGAALAACTVYLFASGAAVAAQRSFAMLAVMLIAVCFDRAAITMRNLAIAALIIMALSPHEIVGPSFQMSFAATAALIAGYAAWSEWRARKGPRDYRPADDKLTTKVMRTVAYFGGGLALTSLIAGTATMLFAVWHFQRIAPLGLVANLAAMPVVTLVIMPAAVLSAFLMPFGLDAVPLRIMAEGISAVTAVALWLSERTPADVTGAIPVRAVLVLTVALVLLTLLTTRLRLLGLPLIAFGVALIAERELPDALISEDARLVAISVGKGALAVNRQRPNGFTIENWRRALNAETLAKPENGELRSSGGESVFRCTEQICLARHRSGAVIAHTDSANAARALCGFAALIVVDDATGRNVCESDESVVVTKRDTARRGAVAVRFGGGAERPSAHLSFSVTEPWRPWHAHRAFSRPSRGLPSYSRDDDQ